MRNNAVALALCLVAVIVCHTEGRTFDKRQIMPDIINRKLPIHMKVGFVETVSQFKGNSPHWKQQLRKLVDSATVLFKAIYKKSCLRPSILQERNGVVSPPTNETYLLYMIQHDVDRCFVDALGKDSKAVSFLQHLLNDPYLPKEFRRTSYDRIVMGEYKPECLDYQTVAHEFLHQLGLAHEHSRPDRNEFVDVFMDLIVGRYRSQYKECKQCTQIDDYDPLSIMHYYPDKVGGGKHEVMHKEKERHKNQIGKGQDLSSSDWYRINAIYCKARE